MPYVDDGPLTLMRADHKQLHQLLLVGIQDLTEAVAFARLRGIDNAVTSQATAAMALAQAARAMIMVIHERRRIHGEPDALGIQ